MAQFPNLPIYTGYNAPGRTECDYCDLEVEGTVPADLDGVFFRMAPDPQWPPRLGQDIYFNGDGMAASFTFKDGHVDLKTRYVRTQKFEAERKARKALFGAYRNPYFDDPSVAGLSRGTANTNIMVHHGKLLALKEDSPPVEMDPLTLETLNPVYDFGGKLTSQTYTAHPKLDPQTGEMLGFGYAAKGLCTRDMVYYVTSPSGEMTREVWFEAPYYCMVHDFGFTKDYVIFPIVPVVGSLERCQAGLPHFAYDKTLDMMLGVMPRDGDAKDIRWFRGPAHHSTHVMNAFNDGPRIHVDMPASVGNAWPFFPDIDGSPFNPATGKPLMTRWTIDMASNDDRILAERISDFGGEFPRIDDRYAGEAHKHGWWVSHDPTKPFDSGRGGSIGGPGWNAWVHRDFTTGRTTSFHPGPTSTVQELIFAPKSADAPEGEGYIIGLVNRFVDLSTDLLVIDAQNVEAGPVATIHLPIRLRNGLHGNWTPADQLAAPAAA